MPGLICAGSLAYIAHCELVFYNVQQHDHPTYPVGLSCAKTARQQRATHKP